MLGAGDRIAIDIFGAPQYSGEALVLSDGSLNLLRVGRVPVQGLTLEQAADAISAQYATFVRRPLVTLALVQGRPVRIGVSGQVNRPGSYTIETNTDNAAQNLSDFPTLTEAIRLAGGITSQADLRQVEVRRQSQGKIESRQVDLWSLLQTGDMTQDVILQAGDAIVIPEVAALSAEESLQLGSSSFSPETIQVYVVGEVQSPGPVSVLPNTPMNQALLAAGGFNNRRARRSTVELVRLQPDGTAQRRTVAVDFGEGVTEETNPTLRNNDVIVVGRSGVAAFGDSTETVLGPFGRILSNILGVFNIFNLFD
jgi:polysaccharide export outer membrane protein